MSMNPEWQFNSLTNGSDSDPFYNIHRSKYSVVFLTESLV